MIAWEEKLDELVAELARARRAARDLEVHDEVTGNQRDDVHKVVVTLDRLFRRVLKL